MENRLLMWLRVASAWLWAVPAAAIPQWAGGLTRRKVLHWAAFIFLLLSFQAVLTMGLSFLFAMDLGLLIEVTAAFAMLSLRGGFELMVVRVRHTAARTRRKAIHLFRRSARAGRRVIRTMIPPADEDERGEGYGLMLATA